MVRSRSVSRAGARGDVAGCQAQVTRGSSGLDGAAADLCSRARAAIAVDAQGETVAVRDVEFTYEAGEVHRVDGSRVGSCWGALACDGVDRPSAATPSARSASRAPWCRPSVPARHT
ncbi:hypothetical protein SMA5143A_7210 [Streptomyces sp. MA5143a]|nr:hypothetical protein SMA5143A_7210 [Streptomyces sp. MA5143a]